MNSATSLQSNTIPASVSMRWEAWLLIATFCLWVATFLSLAPLLDFAGPPLTPLTAAEAVQQYEGKGVRNLVVVASGAFAMLVGIIPLVGLGRQMRASGANLFATLGPIAGLIAMSLLAFHSYLRASLPFANPPNYPPLLDRIELYATNPISTIAMIVWTVAVGVHRHKSCATLHTQAHWLDCGRGGNHPGSADGSGQLRHPVCSGTPERTARRRIVTPKGLGSGTLADRTDLPVPNHTAMVAHYLLRSDSLTSTSVT